MLFTSSRFVNEHLHHHTNKTRLLVHHYNYSTTIYAFALFLDETLASFPAEYYDIQMPCQPFEIIGYYDGIFIFWECEDRITLWNPATREVRCLSIPNLYFPANIWGEQYRYGFGLDPASNEYKVVLTRMYWDEEGYYPYDTMTVIVYYLSTNFWRVFEADHNVDYGVYNSSCSTCLNGIYYWLTSENGWPNTQYYAIILTFDLGSEVFGELPGPRDILITYSANLVIHNDSISVISFDPNKVEKCFDIWVIKEERYWTKESSIGPLVDVGMALGFWKNCEFFVETSTLELVLYNPDTQEKKEFRQRGLYDGLNFFIYKESLVSIKGENEYLEAGNGFNLCMSFDGVTISNRL